MHRLLVRFRIVPYSTPFRRPIRTAHGLLERREGFFVVARCSDGLTGGGEAAPLPTHGTEELADARSVLTALAGREWELEWTAPGAWAEALPGSPPGACSSARLDLALTRAGRLPSPQDRPCGTVLTAVDRFLAQAGVSISTPAARFGVEVALLDLLGRRLGCPVADLLGGALRTDVPVNALLVAQEADQLVVEAKQACAAGFRTLKIKVGAADLDEDLRRVGKLRDAIGPAIALRLDANRSWDLQTARQALRAFEPMRVEFVEEPLSEPCEFPAHRKVVVPSLRFGEAFPVGSGVRIAADESASSPDAARALVARGVIDVLVIKPAALGGLGVGLALAREAAAAGMDVVVTTVLEREVGVAAALHLACVVPAPGMPSPGMPSGLATGSASNLAHGLATLGMLDGPASSALMPQAGCIRLPAGSGLGIAAPPEVQ